MNQIKKSGITRIEESFHQGKRYIGYITAGHGSIKKTFQSAIALIQGGVNMLEIGVPFSDPIADGPVIQEACAQTLQKPISLKNILQLIAMLRKITDIPIILFSYLNPILSAIQTDFFENAKACRIDGILIVDCPYEESAAIRKKCINNNIAPIYVVTPSTSLERVRQISLHGKGFLYYACCKGTTGMRSNLPDNFENEVKAIKQQAILPVAVGFGISSKEMARKVIQYADGVVVGSLFVKAISENKTNHEIKQLAECVNPMM